jgi:hypothetical protein
MEDWCTIPGDETRTDDCIRSSSPHSFGGITRCTFPRALVCILAGVAPLAAFHPPSRYFDVGSNPLWSSVVRRGGKCPSISCVHFGCLSHTSWLYAGVLTWRADISSGEDRVSALTLGRAQGAAVASPSHIPTRRLIRSWQLFRRPIDAKAQIQSSI